MRVALISTPCVPVPPPRYGGTELVVAELAAALDAAGHDVTVFATGDSRPAGRLRWFYERAVWPPDAYDELVHAGYAAAEVARSTPPFDVVHAHIDAFVPFTPRLGVPAVLTIHHDRVESTLRLFSRYDDLTYVAISSRQAELQEELPNHAVVHHGLDPARYALGPGDGGYVVFLGRLAPYKGTHTAIEAARAAGVPIKVGGEAHEVERRYYEERLKPLLSGPGVTALGEVDHEGKLALLGPALATLFPITWEEPFGLVIAESMLCGTPVIAFRRGSAPELVEEGVTGFVVDDLEGLRDAIPKAARLDRARVRARAVERFSSARMARDYVRVYESAIERAGQRAAGRTCRPSSALWTAGSPRHSVLPTG